MQTEQYWQAVLKPQEARGVWAFRILVGGTIFIMAAVATITFGLVGVPTIFIGGSLLLLCSPILLSLAAITSPLWGPLVVLAVVLMLGTAAVATAAFYGLSKFSSSSHTRKSHKHFYEAARDKIEIVREAAKKKVEQAREQALKEAREQAQSEKVLSREEIKRRAGGK